MKGSNRKYKDLRKSAEELLTKKPNDLGEPSTDTLELIHELRVHQIELEMQNEELRQAQLELEESRNKYTDLYDFAPVGYFTLSEKGVIEEVNLTGLALLGIERKNLISRPFFPYIAREDQGVFYSYRERLLKSNSQQTCELRIARRDGTPFYAQLEGMALFDADGKFSHFRVAMLDITARKQAEEALKREHDELEIRVKERTQEVTDANEELQLEINERKQAERTIRESEEKYRTLVEHSYDLICETSIDGRFLYVGPNFWYVLGYESGELLGRNMFEHVHPDDSPAVMAEFQRAVLTRSSGRAVFRFRNKGGEWRWIESTGKPFDTAAGEIRAVITSRDITERKKMEEELAKAQKIESVGILAGGIAHDFNNLLTAILGNISLAKIRIDPEDKVFKRLSEAEKACLRATDLTQQLLTFSKGGTPVKRMSSIGDLIRESAGFALRGSNVRCEFSIPDDLWQIEVDEGQINQVINNLVINADEAMPSVGVIRIKAENVNIAGEPREVGAGLKLAPAKNGKYIKITVEDEGGGIPEEHMSKIFDPYFTTKQSGSGLGLTTTYAIVKKHNGYIAVESEVGAGTRFYLYLPASEKKISTKNIVLNEALISGKRKVLIMDDEETVREVTGEMLKQMGYEVGYARDGSEAVELYRKAKESNRPFDAVIMDLTVPGGMGGKETIEKLKEIDPDVKAVVSSGYSNDPVMAKFADYGFCGVIAKPYKIEELSKTLDKVLNKQHSVCSPERKSY
ncbi:MAG TPA: PAS domain S-box protein [Thermodesulfobacteriota bacterium]|nr:PAS domain S-box protein [Thermodesulfobacteriota bacterium]